LDAAGKRASPGENGANEAPSKICQESSSKRRGDKLRKTAKKSSSKRKGDEFDDIFGSFLEPRKPQKKKKKKAKKGDEFDDMFSSLI
jgi:hypothetical protein